MEHWDVEVTDQFIAWWDELPSLDQRSISARIELLEERGPNLGFPHTSGIQSSRHGNMRELRIQSGGIPIRIFYAFDPRRTAILLIGGAKRGNVRFYAKYVPVADDLYDEHLKELREEDSL